MVPVSCAPAHEISVLGSHKFFQASTFPVFVGLVFND